MPLSLLKTFRNFSRDESGAVTVDWVVLTAGIVGFAIPVVDSVTGGVETLGTNLHTNISTFDENPLNMAVSCFSYGCVTDLNGDGLADLLSNGESSLDLTEVEVPMADLAEDYDMTTAIEINN
ncbi:MAG: hypothetical protein HKO95_18240 [Rhodobacteraceae bacterium]|nr:hypothetical protein [Alphaproteobacteria bacterium]MBT8475861.1 hypothetical protein [Alphaproteobacteria bacterium]NNK68669.1 hypothetical protein [Paracoccaceae bacterium]